MGLPEEEEILARAKTFDARNGFMYYYKADEVVQKAIEEAGAV